MPVIIVIEMILVGIIIAGIFAYMYLISPDVLQQFSRSLERLASSNLDQETTLRILRPYLQEPIAIYSLIAITAGAIPLLEELLKPMALWFFAGKRLSPREGFVGGMICGAAFALLESLGALGNPASGIVAAHRHRSNWDGISYIFPPADLVGWGMAKAWTEGKYRSLVGAYLLAFSFHAVWNISALMAGLKELAQFSPVLIGKFEGFILASPLILVMLAAGSWWCGYLKVNQTLRLQKTIELN